MLFHDADQLTNRMSGNQSPLRVVVIGAGAVGLYAASQLATRGCQVIVVEAGNADLGRFAAESYSIVGHPHTGIRLGRGRSLGGTTSLWGGQLVEFQPVDFRGRDWLTDSQWPVGYDEIAPYYRPTYRNLGMSERLLDDDEVWRGVSCKPPDLGTEFEAFFTRWMLTPNFAELFARQIQHDERMSVLTGHTATGFRGYGCRLNAVRVTNDKGQSSWIEGDTILLAAGTIENARLLLHTAQDPAWEAPWRGNPNVGRYFQDHLGGRIASFHPVDKKRFFKMFCNAVYAGYKFQPKIRLRNEALMRSRVYNTQVFFAFESEVSEHLVYLKQFLKAALYGRKPSGIGDLFRKSPGMARYLLPLMWKYVWDHRIFVPSSAKILMHVQAEHAPRAESRILIDNLQVDAGGLPRVILDWRLAGDELASIRTFAVQIRDALQQGGIGDLKIDEELLSLNPEFLAKLGDTYHQSGGAVMGTSEQDGVVDRNLRVFGTENLYVAGASVFRTTSNANVTFTALAFTTRLLEHLTQGNRDAYRGEILAGSTPVSDS
jgi:choline dehydrogenase-like flavoprotein